MSYSVYKHTFPNGKVYIGITRQEPEKRWGKDGSRYLNKKNGRYTQPLIAKAILKYGWDNIEHEILFNDITKEDAELKEIELIKKYKSNDSEFGYNIENGGKTVGTISQISKKKMSDAAKKRFADKRNHPMYGKHHSEETKRIYSERQKGKYIGADNPFFGKKHSEETRRKMSEAKRNITEETRFKMSEAAKGRKLTDEHKKKLIQGKSKMVICIETNITYPSAAEAARQTSADSSGIIAVCRGKQKTAGGYHWEYTRDDKVG